MTCHKCHNPTPNNLVTCPFCASDLDIRMQRSHQVPRVAQALDGTLAFLTYTTTKFVKHLRRYDFPYTFCGEEVSGAKKKKGQLIYDSPESLTGYCEKCLAELALLEQLIRTGRPVEEIAHAILHPK